MIKLFFFFLLTLSMVGQQVDYTTFSDEQLQEILKKELKDMELKGATPDIIAKEFVIETKEYIVSREAFYRMSVYFDYVAQKMLVMKIENGTDDDATFERIKSFKDSKKRKSYEDYVTSKKTDAAREEWENSTQDGILKLVVEDHNHLSEAEQKRLDGLLILLNRDTYFTHLNISDGKTTRKVMPVRN